MAPPTLPLPLEGGGLGRGWIRRLRWKNGSVKFAVMFMIQKKAIPMVIFLPIPPLKNSLILGSARRAALKKICLKRFSTNALCPLTLPFSPLGRGME
jgi:hypothetical protein